VVGCLYGEEGGYASYRERKQCERNLWKGLKGQDLASRKEGGKKNTQRRRREKNYLLPTWKRDLQEGGFAIIEVKKGPVQKDKKRSNHTNSFGGVQKGWVGFFTRRGGGRGKEDSEFLCRKRKGEGGDPIPKHSW